MSKGATNYCKYNVKQIETITQKNIYIDYKKENDSIIWIISTIPTFQRQ